MLALKTIAILCGLFAPADVVRSRQSGPWSAPETWQGHAVPQSGASIQIRAGHTVVFDQKSDQTFRTIHVAGTLRFASDRSTLLNVGLIKIQAGDDLGESGFDCEAHGAMAGDEATRPALEVGTADQPIPPEFSATIRLVALDGMDPVSCPAIVSCGGRMDFHGAALKRTWTKLADDARPGQTGVVLANPVADWKIGDRVILTASHRDRKEGKTLRPGAGSIPSFTEERTIAAIDGDKIQLNRPLADLHSGTGEFRAEVANLSRNVVVESADPAKGRGHTMYHRGSQGSIAFAEFRHLGKEGAKGRYPIHFHLAGSTMRGSSVVGASIWDSGNRWVTIHGTNFLVVRDCVGYQSVGHGFFLEDGTETLNVIDQNLAVQAFAGKPLAEQVMAFDANSGAGFWWSNNQNTFTRNVAAECDRYGFRYEASPHPPEALNLRILQASGGTDRVDIRTLPFVRFFGNEAHAQLYGLDLGEGTGDVGPDPDHPLVLQETQLWDALWAFRPEVPSLVVDGMKIERSRYGIFQAKGNHQSYRRITIRRTFAAGSPASDEAPRPLRDTSPPVSVITFVSTDQGGKRVVRGTSSDQGPIARVKVNGVEVRPLVDDFSRWEVTVETPKNRQIEAIAEDAAGNVEVLPHRLPIAH